MQNKFKFFDFFIKIITDCFTGKDCQTFDIGRVLWALSVLVYLGLAIVDVLQSKSFKYESFGIGAAGLLGGGGLGLGLKKSTEPEDNINVDINTDRKP